MKNKKLLFFLVILLSLGSFLVWRIVGKMHQKESIATFVGELKELEYVDIQTNTKTKVQPNEKHNLLVFFNSECGHCQSEAKLVEANSEAFKNTNVYFLSTEPLALIKGFSKTYKLLNFHIGQVDAQEVAQQMGVNTFPMLFIYAPDGKLLKQFKGEIKLEAILKYLQ